MTHQNIDEPQRVKRSFRRLIVNDRAKVGATAGWVVGAATNVSRMATCPASQTASTLVVPIHGLFFGDRITGYHLMGQIESAGNGVTIDAALHKATAAAADIVAGAITGTSMTQLSVTADTQVDRSNAYKSITTPEVVGEMGCIYMLITATTGASTDIDLIGVAIEVQQM